MKRTAAKYSSDYRSVLNLAKSYAALTKDNILRYKHILAALLKLKPEIVTHLLGLDTLIVPNQLAFKSGKTDNTIAMSSQVSELLSLHGGHIHQVLKSLGESPFEIGLIHLACAMLLHPHSPMLELLKLNLVDIDSGHYEEEVLKRAADAFAADEVLHLQNLSGERLKSLHSLRDDLKTSVIGQEDAIDELIARVGIASSVTAAERAMKPISFAFVGHTGTGKTLLAKEFRDGWDYYFRTGKPAILDMSRFSVETLITDIAGRDPCWKDGGKAGELTRLAAANPKGVIILDNIEKAHPGALAPIAAMLNDGYLIDEFSRERVSFADNIIILISKCGGKFIDSKKFEHLRHNSGGMVPREKLLEGIEAELKTFVPTKVDILTEIFGKTSAPIAFHRHTPESIHSIVFDSISSTLHRIARIYNVEVEADPHELAAFFVDTIIDFGSAHRIGEMVEGTLTLNLEKEMLRIAAENGTCRAITFAVDPLPKLEQETTTIEDRARLRLSAAKRLDFSINTNFAANELVIHFTDLHHTVLPSIEDAGWFSVTPPNVSAENLVGLEKAWEKVRRLLDRHDKKSPSAMSPGHVLLYGPPGTGKTAFAKAIAKTLNRSIICVNASRFTANLCDTTAINELNSLFAAAERTRSIIFLDECDAIGSREAVSSVQASVINTLLTLLDGYEENGVMVIGATNLPEKLDDALTRPGRLHTRIKIDLLRNREDREKLVELFCRKTNRTIPEELKAFIVDSTFEWASANILSVLTETFDRAGDKEPTREDFVRARTSDYVGEETQYRALNANERRHVAIHEAGHALIATLHHHNWIQVTVNGFDHTAGFLETAHNCSIGRTKEQLLETIDIALGGTAAERLFDTLAEGSESDLKKATKLARRTLMGGINDEGELAIFEDDDKIRRLRVKINAILNKRLNWTIGMLKAHKTTLLAIAEELALRGTLFPEDIRHHLEKETK